MVDIKPVFLVQVAFLLFGRAFLLLLAPFAFRIHRLLPHPFPLVELAELRDIHLHPRLVLQE